MRTGIRTLVFGLLIAAASAWAAAAAWQADFTPSTFNPGVGDVVEFAVCQECIGSVGQFRYLWDFNNDGVVDMDTDYPVAATTFAVAEFYEVRLTVRDAGGREVTRLKGIYAGPVPVYAVRRVAEQTDGSLLVLISFYAVSENAGPGLAESIPVGWSYVTVDPAGTFGKRDDRDDGKLVFSTGWTSLEPGTETIYSYSLHRNYAEAAQRPRLTGKVSGYAEGRFEIFVCGELAVP